MTLDVVVLGGGPAGAATALELARAGAAVAVLDRPRPRDRPRVGETLPPDVIGPLARLGVWEAFRADGHAPAPAAVACWGSAQPYENEYILNPYGEGWHLDRDRFDAMLLRAAADAGAAVHVLAAGEHLVPDGAGWRADVGGRVLRAAFAVDATGRAAVLARRDGHRDGADRLVGLVRFGQTPAAALDEPRTTLEATPEGWWYAAALPRGRAVVAFFTDADLLPSGAAAREERFTALLAGTALVAELAPAAGSLHTAAARTGARAGTGRGWLAVGDAARTLDPLSGRGLCTALDAAIRAGAALAAPDRVEALAGYHRWHEHEHQHHLETRAQHYDRERRWPQLPFWRRRHTGRSEVV